MVSRPKVVDEYESFLASILERQGFFKAGVKILSIVFSEPEEISMDELVVRTGYSLSTISTSLRMKERSGIIRRVSHPGTKKVFIRPFRDFISEFEKHIIEAHENQILPAKERFPSFISSLRTDMAKKRSSSSKELYKKYLSIIQDHYDQVELLDNVFSDLRENLHQLKRKRYNGDIS